MKKNPKIIGIYRLTMKIDCNNFRASSIQGIIKKIKVKGREEVVYELVLKEETLFNSKIIRELEKFKSMCYVIVSNALTKELFDIGGSIYTRDLFNRD